MATGITLAGIAVLLIITGVNVRRGVAPWWIGAALSLVTIWVAVWYSKTAGPMPNGLEFMLFILMLVLGAMGSYAWTSELRYALLERKTGKRRATR